MLGIKQKEMAETIGCTPSAYSKKENGTVKLSLPESQQIVKLINDKLKEKNLSSQSYETIFFVNNVPNMEQRGD